MKFVAPTPPPKIRNEKLYKLALVYAAIIVVCMLGQLFRFDNITDAVTDIGMFGGTLGVVFWTVLEVMQLLALPFLLRLHISPLLRFMSVIATFLVPVFWAAIAGWQVSTMGNALGVFGTEVPQLGEWWATIVVTVIALVGASASLASIGTYKQIRAALSK